MTTAAPTTFGPSDAVPCPWCKKPNEFEHEDELLEVGAEANCDACGKPFRVVSIARVTRVALERVDAA